MSKDNPPAQPGHLRDNKPFMNRMTDEATAISDRLNLVMYGKPRRVEPAQYSAPLAWKKPAKKKVKK